MGRYFVFNPTADKPRKEYDDYAEARNDAQAVSLKADAKVFVLEVVAEVNCRRLIETTELAGIRNELQGLCDDAKKLLEDVGNAKTTV